MNRSSSACERNKDPILSVLREIAPSAGLVLEIGSGTGRHAAYFAPYFPRLQWQPTDLSANLPGIRAWRAAAGAPNLNEPMVLDLFAERWPVAAADMIVCINVIHIVSWEGVERLFAGVANILPTGGVMYVYGPYRYRGRQLEPSNERFDRMLRERHSHSGVREFEAVDGLAASAGLRLAGDRPMPANNRSIWWIRE